jgi:hypothetical protein
MFDRLKSKEILQKPEDCGFMPVEQLYGIPCLTRTHTYSKEHQDQFELGLLLNQK